MMLLLILTSNFDSLLLGNICVSEQTARVAKTAPSGSGVFSMKLIKWVMSLIYVRLLFLSDQLQKGANKIGTAFCGATATRNNWSSRFSLRVKQFRGVIFETIAKTIPYKVVCFLPTL